MRICLFLYFLQPDNDFVLDLVIVVVVVVVVVAALGQCTEALVA